MPGEHGGLRRRRQLSLRARRHRVPGSRRWTGLRTGGSSGRRRSLVHRAPVPRSVRLCAHRLQERREAGRVEITRVEAAGGSGEGHRAGERPSWRGVLLRAGDLSAAGGCQDAPRPGDLLRGRSGLPGSGRHGDRDRGSGRWSAPTGVWERTSGGSRSGCPHGRHHRIHRRILSEPFEDIVDTLALAYDYHHDGKLVV